METNRPTDDEISETISILCASVYQGMVALYECRKALGDTTEQALKYIDAIACDVGEYAARQEVSNNGGENKDQ